MILRELAFLAHVHEVELRAAVELGFHLIDGQLLDALFRFAVRYWHTFRGMGGDPFGPGCAVRPWEDGTDSVEMAKKRVRVAFEFIEKLGAPYFCFHDRDVAPEGKGLKETNANLDAVV